MLPVRMIVIGGAPGSEEGRMRRVRRWYLGAGGELGQRLPMCILSHFQTRLRFFAAREREKKVRCGVVLVDC